MFTIKEGKVRFFPKIQETNLQEIYSDLLSISGCAIADTFRWYWDRGVELPLVDKETRLEQLFLEGWDYISGLENEMNRIKDLALGIPEDKRKEFRDIYRGLLTDRKIAVDYILQEEMYVDASLPEFQPLDRGCKLPTVGESLITYLEMYVDEMTSQQLSDHLEGIQILFEAKDIYFEDYVKLSTVLLYRLVKKQGKMKVQMRDGGYYLQIPPSGYQNDLQRFRKLWADIQARAHEEEAAMPFYELRERSYLSEDELISAIDQRSLLKEEYISGNVVRITDYINEMFLELDLYDQELQLEEDWGNLLQSIV